jgi:uncharacterized membrane protein
MGLVAGVFGLYAHTIMPGLGRTDDRTFVGAFQAIDRAIINPWFLGGGFGGALVFTVVAAVRRRFNEARWTSWNLLRVVTSTVAFGVLAWALVL